jgi:hypothetical protein
MTHFFSLLLLSVLILMCRPVLAMPYIPTYEIAQETPDPKIMEELGGRRMIPVRNFLKTNYRDFSGIGALLNADMSSYCPKFASLTGSQKISFFALILDMYIHGLLLEKRAGMPVPDPKTMSPKQLEALEQEYGDTEPVKNREEFYKAIGRFDEAQLDMKAREMLQLFQSGPVSPVELHALLKPDGIKNNDPFGFVKWLMSTIQFCR